MDSILDPLARVTYIYGLVDPNTGQLRYIGKADNPRDRLNRHLRNPEIVRRNYKANWLRKLLASGQSPTLIILDTVSADTWQESERQWIAYHRSIGTPLTNATDGGDGIRGLKHSDEAKAKISARHKGRPISEYQRMCISKAQTGRKRTQDERNQQSDRRKAHWETLSSSEKEIKISQLNHGWPQELRDKVGNTLTGMKRRKDASSKHVGVSWYKAKQCWRAYITKDHKQKHVGFFSSEEEAVIARDKALLELKA